ncbi:S8 family peptidase [Paenibacillus sp.]|uniref:S8 family peptidase n=1 Tax=Paenibacillus sp. TaxID=58172 RepID=UPI002D25A472|nr:S8 family peptidase [Paenibacillus sp.]HZG84672.1 S8 family peptidase [Paenibacillus sp.]
MDKRKIGAGVLVALFALALPAAYWLQQDRPGDGPRAADVGDPARRPAARFEHRHKQKILASDVSTTAALCRLQCRSDLASFAKRNGGRNQEQIRLELAEMRGMHPHLHALAWVDGGSALTDGSLGNAAPDAKARWEEAIRAVRAGKRYESKPLQGTDGDQYFVLGEPAGAGRGQGAVGFVHQDVLRQVASNQSRNLRLKEFPDEDKRFGIRAVDPETGREVDVDTPEENQGVSHYRKREVVVKFKKPPSPDDIARMKAETKAVSVKQLGPAFVFDSRQMTTAQLMDYFKKRDIEYVEPHYMYVTNETSAAEPNDELYGRYQWNLPIIETPAGWTLSKGNAEVVVGVIDTGVALSHPDLKEHIVEGYNVVEPASPPEDDVGHGTHVAGVVSALTDNGQGVAGMTWYNKIMPVKVLDSTGMGSTYSVAEGIIWATDHGAKVINMSLGNYASAEFLHDAIRYAFDRDVVLIAATGNDNTSDPGFPAAYPEVFAVSATNQDREKATFSNYGDYVDVVAPGENIASTYTDNQYAALSGTSMASPHVAALAALIRSANPALKNTQVYDIMRKSVDDLGTPGRDPYYGYGQINVSRALQLAVGQKPEAASDDGAERRTVGRKPRESFFEELVRSMFGS